MSTSRRVAIGSSLALGVMGLSSPNASAQVQAAQSGVGGGRRATWDVTAREFGAAGDGKNDDTAAIQMALDAAAGIGGTVFLPSGTYLQSSTLVIPDGVTLSGVRNSSKLVCRDDIVQISSKRQEGRSRNNITIVDLIVSDARVLTADGRVRRTSYQIVLTNPIHCTLQNVETNTQTDSQVRWNLQNVGGVHLEQLGKANNFVNRIENCWIRQGSLWIESTDTQVTNGFFWGQTVGFAIRIDGNNVRVLNADLVGSEASGAIWVPNMPSQVAVIGCFFDGSYPSFSTGHGINGALRSSMIEGNSFWNNSGSGVRLFEAHGVSITGNAFRNNNRSSKNYPDISLEPSVTSRCDGVVVSSNLFENTISTGSGRSYCVSALSDRPDAIGPTIISSNDLSEGSTGYAGSMKLDIANSDPTVLRYRIANNQNMGDAARGVFTLRAGQGAIDVAHRLSAVPSAECISIVPLSMPSGGQAWCVTAIGASTFKVEFLRPAIADVRFAWKATLEML